MDSQPGPAARRLRRGCCAGLAVVAVPLAIAIGLPLLIRLWVHLQAQPYVYREVDQVPARRVAVVFGALVYSDGTPSPMLQDRVETAVQLYQAGKVEKILMSGDNRFVHYNEPAAMIRYAESLGVPQEDLAPDFAGRRTYDTCYRARHIFGLQDAILITQAFHLPRTVYTCRVLGMDAVGFVADRQPYDLRTLAYLQLREFLATQAAWWDLHVRHPVPVLGDPIEIP